MISSYVFFSTVIQMVILLVAVLLYLRLRRLRLAHDELLHQKEVIFSFVHDVGGVFADAGGADTDLMLKRVLFYALRTTHAGAGALFLATNEAGQFRAHAVSGSFPPLGGNLGGLAAAASKSQHIERLVRSQLIHSGEGLIGSVVETGTPLLIADAERDPRVPRYEVDFLRIHTMMLVPMRFHRRVLGVLAVVNRVDGKPFIQADLNLLQILADQASVSIHFDQFREALNEKRRMDHDLAVARHIQSLLQPKEVPALPGCEVAGFTDPALEVGGDYYDFVPVDDQHIGLVVADVSGKGISGALVMSICRSVLRTEARGCVSPAAVLRAVDEMMVADMIADMFVSLLYMVLDLRTRDLRVARAGHEKPLLYSSRDHRLKVIESPGLAVGLGQPELFNRVLEETVVKLEPGDSILAYTDGVTEATNEQGEEWGLERLQEAMHLVGGEHAADLLAGIRERLDRFCGGNRRPDDTTLLALRVLP